MNIKHENTAQAAVIGTPKKAGQGGLICLQTEEGHEKLSPLDAFSDLTFAKPKPGRINSQARINSIYCNMRFKMDDSTYYAHCPRPLALKQAFHMAAQGYSLDISSLLKVSTTPLLPDTSPFEIGQHVEGEGIFIGRSNLGQPMGAVFNAFAAPTDLYDPAPPAQTPLGPSAPQTRFTYEEAEALIKQLVSWHGHDGRAAAPASAPNPLKDTDEQLSKWHFAPEEFWRSYVISNYLSVLHAECIAKGATPPRTATPRTAMEDVMYNNGEGAMYNAAKGEMDYAHNTANTKFYWRPIRFKPYKAV